MDGPLADGGAVLSAPLSDFAGLLEIPLFTEKLESRGTHRVVVSIFPPSWVDGELKQRLLEFFEEEFNAELKSRGIWAELCGLKLELFVGVGLAVAKASTRHPPDCANCVGGCHIPPGGTPWGGGIFEMSRFNVEQK